MPSSSTLRGGRGNQEIGKIDRDNPNGFVRVWFDNVSNTPPRRRVSLRFDSFSRALTALSRTTLDLYHFLGYIEPVRCKDRRERRNRQVAKTPPKEKRVLHYQRDALDPKRWLNFVQLDPFPAAWKGLGLSDDDLRALEILIMSWPDKHPVMAGTGGLRKLRFAPGAWNSGKSGAARIYYAYFPAYGLVTLIYAHGKNEMEAIADNQKKVIRQLTAEIQASLDDKPRSRKGTKE